MTNEQRPQNRMSEIIVEITKDGNWGLKNPGSSKATKIVEILNSNEYLELIERLEITGKTTKEREKDLEELEAFYETWNTEMNKFDKDGKLKPLN